jgi:hypothetical protein
MHQIALTEEVSMSEVQMKQRTELLSRILGPISQSANMISVESISYLDVEL